MTGLPAWLFSASPDVILGEARRLRDIAMAPCHHCGLSRRVHDASWPCEFASEISDAKAA